MFEDRFHDNRQSLQLRSLGNPLQDHLCCNLAQVFGVVEIERNLVESDVHHEGFYKR
jgi:hypothetical protein